MFTSGETAHLVSEPGTATIGVAVVSFNTREYLRACLDSVLSESPSEVIVVDNGSSDGSVEMVRQDYPTVVLHLEPTNPGYGAGANRAIERTASPYVLLLNTDTLLQPGALRSLGDYLDRHPRAGVVGPRLTNPDGTLQPSCFPFPSPLVTLLDTSPVGRLIALVPALRNRYPRTWAHTHARTVPCVLGAALAIRREAFEAVGGFDESFFMYFEETDLCYRLHRAGWETHFAPVTDVAHAGGVSTMQRRTAMRAQLFLSSLRYHERHHGTLGLAGATLVVKSIVLAKLARDAIRYHLTRDDQARHIIAQDRAAWRRVLSAPWRQHSRSRPPSSGVESARAESGRAPT